MPHAIKIISLLCAALLCGRVTAQSSPVVLVAHDLSAETAELLAIQDGQLVLAAPSDQITRRPIHGVLLITTRSWLPPFESRAEFLPPTFVGPLQVPSGQRSESQNPAGELVLVDGQRIPGELILNTEPAEDEIIWKLRAGAAMNVPIDRIAALRLHREQAGPRGSPRGGAAAEDDHVELTNNDVLVGFVEAIGPVVAIDTDAGVVRTPIDRVRSIALANPPEPLQGRVIQISNGARLVVDDLLFSDGAIALPSGADDPDESTDDADDEPARPAVSDLIAAAPRAELFAPLASYKRSVNAGARPIETVSTPQTPLGLADMIITGPATARFMLPPDATRFATWAELPITLRRWGSMRVRVSAATTAGDRELWTGVLDASNPYAEINVALEGDASHLVFTIEDHEFGPVQDTVRLRHPILLLDP